ncbi:hypothetical protein DPMN_107717 [Dreissena polymorpha]|uniref:Uncharacterized protein n=1 Tax=Dreissena polymorpha TaxID=45954 RepID=A0A9D4K7E4_DREPO|nr:hypothetical protein DPMN_107717 [Dreissena polymorpha]
MLNYRFTLRAMLNYNESYTQLPVNTMLKYRLTGYAQLQSYALLQLNYRLTFTSYTQLQLNNKSYAQQQVYNKSYTKLQVNSKSYAHLQLNYRFTVRAMLNYRFMFTVNKKTMCSYILTVGGMVNYRLSLNIKSYSLPQLQVNSNSHDQLKVYSKSYAQLHYYGQKAMAVVMMTNHQTSSVSGLEIKPALFRFMWNAYTSIMWVEDQQSYTLGPKITTSTNELSTGLKSL